ncbi:hypothetical protein EBR77_01930, partial [bacterium]|nr:hypothetical protein [bacterium]
RANIISYSEAFELLKAADDKEKFDVLRQIFIEYHLKIDMASHSDEELKKTMFLIDNLYPQFYALIFTILQAKQNITKESILEILIKIINTPVIFLTDEPLLYIDHFIFYNGVNESITKILQKYAGPEEDEEDDAADYGAAASGSGSRIGRS